METAPVRPHPWTKRKTWKHLCALQSQCWNKIALPSRRKFEAVKAVAEDTTPCCRDAKEVATPQQVKNENQEDVFFTPRGGHQLPPQHTKENRDRAEISRLINGFGYSHLESIAYPKAKPSRRFRTSEADSHMLLCQPRKHVSSNGSVRRKSALQRCPHSTPFLTA